MGAMVIFSRWFFGRQLFWDKEKEEALILVTWESKKLWKSIPMAEVNLIQGKLDYAIKFSEQSISINPERIKPKIILAIAKTRVGDADEALEILNEIHKKNISAEIACQPRPFIPVL